MKEDSWVVPISWPVIHSASDSPLAYASKMKQLCTGYGHIPRQGVRSSSNSHDARANSSMSVGRDDDSRESIEMTTTNGQSTEQRLVRQIVITMSMSMRSQR